MAMSPRTNTSRPGRVTDYDAQADGRIAKPVPELLFVCVHNVGRSQMAAG